MKLPEAKPAKLESLAIEYERFFSVSLDMLCISSYDGHFKVVNKAFEETLGFTSEEMCTKSYMEFIHPDDVEKTINEVTKQLNTKQQVLYFENRYRHKDGTYRWLSWKSAPVGDFMYAVARDITESKLAHEELKTAKDALEAVNKELESFSYSVAHDLQSPIRNIIGFSSMVLEDTSSTLSDATKKNLTRVVGSAKKMGTLITGLLDFSKLTRRKLNKQTVNLSLMAKELIEELRNGNPDRKIDFILASNITAEGDMVLLRAVMSNLFSNAWKYTSKCTHLVTIEFGETEKDGKRTFFVKDNGVGFNPKYVSKLFGVFQRLHSEEDYTGSGIGLAIAQRIIVYHGGKIWAEAELDKGATFYFTL